MASENIAAISTGLVASGVAVIRISGDTPLKIAEQMFKPTGKVKVCDFEPNRLYTGEILAENFSDFGMCVYFKGPKSFTGEDTVEFHSHGGVAITRGILNKILSLGVRLARNGEFTKRAFLNGKLSLSSAEGLIDMINSESESGVKAGYYLYREKLLAKVNDIQNVLTDALSQIDVDMDFPEEDIESTATPVIARQLQECVTQIDDLLKTYRVGRTLKNGVSVAIVGKPNTGKSSTLNALLNFDKAIVSDVAGTTRDVVEGSIDINGVRFNFADTAGIRQSNDNIEMLGVNLSKKIVNQSDLIVFIADGLDFNDKDEEILDFIKDKNHIFVVNKTDCSNFTDERADLYISAINKTNVDGLRQAIYEKTVGNGIDLNGDFLCEERHFEALNNAKEKLLMAKASVGVAPLDLLAIDVKDAWDYLGEISGKTATEEIINNIFSKFCVGK